MVSQKTRAGKSLSHPEKTALPEGLFTVKTTVAAMKQGPSGNSETIFTRPETTAPSSGSWSRGGGKPQGVGAGCGAGADGAGVGLGVEGGVTDGSEEQVEKRTARRLTAIPFEKSVALLLTIMPSLSPWDSQRGATRVWRMR